MYVQGSQHWIEELCRRSRTLLGRWLKPGDIDYWVKDTHTPVTQRMRKPVEVTHERRRAAAVMALVTDMQCLHARTPLLNDACRLRGVGQDTGVVCWLVLYVHRNRRLIRPDGNPGWPLRLPHNTWALTGHRCAWTFIIIRSMCVCVCVRRGGGGGGGLTSHPAYAYYSLYWVVACGHGKNWGRTVWKSR